MDIWVVVYTSLLSTGELISVDLEGAGVPETIVYSSTLGLEDSGWYTLRIAGSGGSCDSPVNISCTKVADL
jgi:purine-nucleoside phosphorylase